MLNTSRSLLERLQDRTDGQAWQRLLAIYEPWLRGWLSRTPLGPSDRDDVLQEILVVVSEKLQKFDHNGQPGAFRAWLRMILTIQVRQFLRNRHNRPGATSPQPPSGWLDQLADPVSALSRQWDEEHDRHVVRRLLASIEGEFNTAT
jgi:RNA polymerase sigma-70 factor (ECF subfamily)